MDWFAIMTLGAYPTPTPTDAQRAAYGISYGLLGLVSIAVAVNRGASILEFLVDR